MCSPFHVRTANCQEVNVLGFVPLFIVGRRLVFMSEPWDALGARMPGPPHDDNRHSALPAVAAKARACAGQACETPSNEAARTPVAATEALGAATSATHGSSPGAAEPRRLSSSKPPGRLLRVHHRPRGQTISSNWFFRWPNHGRRRGAAAGEPHAEQAETEDRCYCQNPILQGHPPQDDHGHSLSSRF